MRSSCTVVRIRNLLRSTSGFLRLLVGATLLTLGTMCLGATSYAYDTAGRLTSVAYADNS